MYLQYMLVYRLPSRFTRVFLFSDSTVNLVAGLLSSHCILLTLTRINVHLLCYTKLMTQIRNSRNVLVWWPPDVLIVDEKQELS